LEDAPELVELPSDFATRRRRDDAPDAFKLLRDLGVVLPAQLAGDFGPTALRGISLFATASRSASAPAFVDASVAMTRSR
jgi:hypothetical protein